MKKEVVILLVLILMLSGCSEKELISHKNFKSLNYEVTECLDSGDDNIDINIIGDKIIIKQVIEFNCCFEVDLSYKETDSIMRIYEDFSGEECDCNCKKEITAEISSKDIDEIEFYSRINVEYPYELLSEREI